MPRYRRSTTTLGGMAKPPAGACCMCGKLPEKNDAMGWTWSRQRIHDRCMPIWMLTNRGRRAFGPWVASAVEVVLERNGGRLCDPCLALALSLSLEEARLVIAATTHVPGFHILPVECHSCGRSSEALCLVPPGSGAAFAASPTSDIKCARCSRVLTADLEIVSHGDDRFHRACWQLLSADERIRTSRALTRQSRNLISQSRETLDRPRPRDR
jgi:hypothetical protein